MHSPKKLIYLFILSLDEIQNLFLKNASPYKFQGFECDYSLLFDSSFVLFPTSSYYVDSAYSLSDEELVSS